MAYDHICHGTLTASGKCQGTLCPEFCGNPVTRVKDGPRSKLIAHFGQQIIIENRDENLHDKLDNCNHYGGLPCIHVQNRDHFNISYSG